jgi:hypothetical protein
MTIALTDITYKKSKTITDTTVNGGRMGDTSVVSGAKHSLFPRVTKTERVNGVTRYRKEFWKNSNADDDIAYGVLQWIEVPSNAGDRFYLKKGTSTDTQSGLTSPPAGTVHQWIGGGQLQTALSGAETSVAITMESNDYVFENGAYLHIADKVQVSQTVASDVVVGDSVTFGTSWTKITSTTDITYPNGVYLGDNNVLSLKSTTNEEWLTIAENLYEDESIGTGDGTTSVELSTLTNKDNGICQVTGRLPVISSLTAADAALTVYLNQDGTVNTATSDASAGELNMTTGVWTTDIVWTTAPGTGKDITITYREKPYSYSGNIATVALDDQVANAYTVAMTRCSACLYNAEIVSSVGSEVVTTAGDGDFDYTTYPIVAHNEGAERDTITITFSSSSAFAVVGSNLGAITTGNTSTNVNAVNPDTGEDLFFLDATGWSGTWASGDTLVFELYESAQSVWIKEVVPAATDQEPHNLCVIGFYLE